MVIKGGVIAWANMGDPNASIPTPEPVFLLFHDLVLSHRQASFSQILYELYWLPYVFFSYGSELTS